MLIIIFIIIYLFIYLFSCILVDQDNIKWFHHSWLPWSVDVDH